MLVVDERGQGRQLTGETEQCGCLVNILRDL